MKHFIAVLLTTICLVSCGRNFWEARYISKKFIEGYTGIEKLIRIDGYYYNKDSSGLRRPFLLSDNGKIKIASGVFNNHSRIQEVFAKNRSIGNGSYSLLGDTIKVRWALRYDLGSYEIFSTQLAG